MVRDLKTYKGGKGGREGGKGRREGKLTYLDPALIVKRLLPETTTLSWLKRLSI